MLNTKLNLYNPEWLELVFANRNKSYGAYELRQHYSSTIVKAMAIAFVTVVAASLSYSLSLKPVVIDLPKFKETIVDLKNFKKEKPKKIEEPVQAALKAKPAHAINTTKNLPPVVKPDELVKEEPVRNIDIKGESGSVTAKGIEGALPVIDPVPATGGTGTEPIDDKTIYGTGTLDAMPEPVGGVAAWSKFLSRNLRFPSEAQEARKSGRVIMSFVIEKDGRLSDIRVQNSVGYGMDEEAIRVLKLAKPWKPGKQNGQPVRVRYVIPMNFQLNEE